MNPANGPSIDQNRPTITAVCAAIHAAATPDETERHDCLAHTDNCRHPCYCTLDGLLRSLFTSRKAQGSFTLSFLH
jgi:hypothetical protein